MIDQLTAIAKGFVLTPTYVSSQDWIRILFFFCLCKGLHFLVDKIGMNTTHYKSLSPKDRKEFQARIVSTLHALVAFSVCLYVVITDIEFRGNPVHGHNVLAHWCYSLGIGYFVADSTQVLGAWLEPVVPIVLHHYFAAWGFLLCLGMAKISWFGALLLVTEATNPVNNTFWHLEKLGMKGTPLYKLVGKLFFIMWIIFRMSIFPYVFYKMYSHWDEMQDCHEHATYIISILCLNVAFLFSLNYAHFWITVRHLWSGTHTDQKKA